MTLLQLLKPTVRNYGLFAEHNMPCAVCWENSAVLNCQDNIFQPCWTCQSKGYVVRKKHVPRRKRKRIPFA